MAVPGVGKSTTLFAWGRSLKKKVLWVHFENGTYTLVNFENGKEKQCELYNTDLKWNIIVDFAVWNKSDVVLLDGIRDDMKNIFAQINHNPSVFWLLALLIKAEDIILKRKVNCLSHTIM